MSLQSPAFASGQVIPQQYTGDGQGVSPPLRWSGSPKGTRELALIVDDPDAPGAQPWVHWVVYNIPPDVGQLAEGIGGEENLSNLPAAAQGVNSLGQIGYHPPHPPRGHGVHHYHFKLYALDAEMKLKAGLSKEGLLDAISGHVLAECELIGTCERK